MTTVIERLRESRTEARQRADEIVTRAATEERDLSADELSAYQDALAAEREAADRLEHERDHEVRELRASVTRQPDAYPLGSWLMRAIDEASGAGAAFTPGEFPAAFFDRLAAASVGLRSGFRVVTTTRDSITFPRWIADTSAGWVAEGQPIVSVDADADTVTATPRKLAGLQVVSNETLADSSPSVYDVIASGLVRAVALKADLGFFEGSGTPPEITGLLNTANIQTIPGVGIPSSLDDIADAISALEEENATAGAIVMSPFAWSLYITLKETAQSIKPVLQDSAGSGAQGITRAIYGLPVYLSSQIDPSKIYVYEPDQIVVVRREDVRVETDSSRLFNSDQSEIRAIARMDIVVPNPQAVVVLEDVATVS